MHPDYILVSENGLKGRLHLEATATTLKAHKEECYVYPNSTQDLKERWGANATDLLGGLESPCRG